MSFRFLRFLPGFTRCFIQQTTPRNGCQTCPPVVPENHPPGGGVEWRRDGRTALHTGREFLQRRRSDWSQGKLGGGFKHFLTHIFQIWLIFFKFDSYFSNGLKPPTRKAFQALDYWLANFWMGGGFRYFFIFKNSPLYLGKIPILTRIFKGVVTTNWFGIIVFNLFFWLSIIFGVFVIIMASDVHF